MAGKLTVTYTIVVEADDMNEAFDTVKESLSDIPGLSYFEIAEHSWRQYDVRPNKRTASV